MVFDKIRTKNFIENYNIKKIISVILFILLEIHKALIVGYAFAAAAATHIHLFYTLN